MLRQFMPHILLMASAAAAGVAAAIRPALAEGLRVSGPFEHDNLAVYFLHGTSADGPVPLTLDEALMKGGVKVHETGTVSELRIENTGDEDVLVHAGDIVKGGWQDRVVTTTFILKPKSGAVPVAVFCVEAGRWTARGQESAERFESAKEMLPSRKAKMSLRSDYVRAARAASAPASSAAETAAAGMAADVAAGAEQVQQRLALGGSGPAANSQSEIWAEVGNIQAALSSSIGARVNAAESESSLQLALENEKLDKARTAYIDGLKPRGDADGDIVGYAFAVNGRLSAVDVYGSNALFRKLWPKLVKASATEALSAAHDAASPKAVAPKPSDVEAFMAREAAGREDQIEPAPGIKLKARESADVFGYVTESDSGRLVHHSILAR